VILGAGLYTFAFRKPEMMEYLEVFEVDHPATQEFKLHRLAELEWEHPAKLHFIPIDFMKESLNGRKPPGTIGWRFLLGPQVSIRGHALTPVPLHHPVLLSAYLLILPRAL
jgi:hypothetical protein